MNLEAPPQDSPVVAIVGGSGKLGNALARRWAARGLPILIGSRDPANAARAAGLLSASGGPRVGSGTYAEVSAQADIIVVAVPAESQVETLRALAPVLAGKLVVDTTVPLVPPRVMRVQLPPEGSAAARAQSALGDGARLVSAFHNVPAHLLAQPDRIVECDVLVFGDDRASREQVVALAGQAGLRGLHAGPLVNAAAAEALTSTLIFMNKHYASAGTGIRITGLAPTAS